MHAESANSAHFMRLNLLTLSVCAVCRAGASGLVIEENAADELGLHAFGEMYVAGMGGRLLCQFRRGQELTIGPVSFQRPLFMQMSLTGVVAGAPGPVVGILG